MLAATNQNHYSGPRPKIVPCLGRYDSNTVGHRTKPAGAAQRASTLKRPRGEGGTRHKALCFFARKAQVAKDAGHVHQHYHVQTCICAVTKENTHEQDENVKQCHQVLVKLVLVPFVVRIRTGLHLFYYFCNTSLDVIVFFMIKTDLQINFRFT